MKTAVVSQRDIAAKAGVSVSAVSLALRNHPKISPEVRERIQKIARRLGYHADPKVAQLMEHLRTARTNRVRSKLAVLIPELTPAQLKNYRPIVEMLVGAREQAADAGFDLDVFHLVEPGMSTARLRVILRTRGIQGIFVAPFASGVGRIDFDFSGFAAATAGYSIVDPLLHRSCPNYLQMMDEILEWVTRQGYRRVGFILTYRPGGIGHKLFSSSFLYYQNQIPTEQRIPILSKTEITDPNLLRWIATHEPEVIISSGPIYTRLTGLGVPIPKKIKFASIDLSEPPQDAAGVDHQYRLVGGETVKLILSQTLLNMTGVPDHPKIVLVDSHWRPGFTMPGNPSRDEARATPLRQD
ncbi:MAG TPA: LacI family DNA-binding transcriptional regulator [Opitutaceae bacterium]